MTDTKQAPVTTAWRCLNLPCGAFLILTAADMIAIRCPVCDCDMEKVDPIAVQEVDGVTEATYPAVVE